MRQGEEGARSEAKSNDRFDSGKEIKVENLLRENWDRLRLAKGCD